MAVSPNNSTAGTSDGGNLIATLGNSFLTSVASLGNVATSTAKTAEELLKTSTGLFDQYAILKLSVRNANKAPASTIPNSQVSNVQDYVSNPANVKNILFYATLALSLGAATWYLAKKF